MEQPKVPLFFFSVAIMSRTWLSLKITVGVYVFDWCLRYFWRPQVYRWME